ncbi:MAG: YihY/virulence factor BrkB family protein [Planctomycetes bacterium]|nr:YihY/virulence factor BrkB family protein [Planctomycetota bacterium]
MKPSERRPRGLLSAEEFQVASRLDRALDWTRQVLWRKQVKPFYDKFWEDLVLEKAAGLTFTSLFALTALVMVLVYVLGTKLFEEKGNKELMASGLGFIFPSDKVVGGMMEYLENFSNGKAQEKVREQAEESSALRAAKIPPEGGQIIKFVGFAVSLILVIRSLDKTFNQIWAGREVKRSFGQYVVMFIVIIGVVPFIFSLAPVLRQVAVSNEAGWEVERLFDFLPFVLGPLGFWMIYYLVPISEKRTRSHFLGSLVGALFAFAAFWLLKRMFDWAMGKAYGYMEVTSLGPLTLDVLAVALMWFYFLWIIVLVGLQLSLDMTIRFAGGLYGKDNTLPNEVVAVVALHMMADAYWNPVAGQPLYITAEDLSKRGKVPIYQAEAVLKNLRRQNIIIPVEGTERHYQPTVHLYDLTVNDIITRTCGYTVEQIERVVHRIRTPELRQMLEGYFAAFHHHREEFAALSFADVPAMGARLEHYRDPESETGIPVPMRDADAESDIDRRPSARLLPPARDGEDGPKGSAPTAAAAEELRASQEAEGSGD